MRYDGGVGADPKKDPPDPFEGVEDLIDGSAPPWRPSSEVLEEPSGNATLAEVLRVESGTIERHRVLHELGRSLAHTHPLEGDAILSRVEAALLLSAASAAWTPARCPSCGIALRVLEQPRVRPVDPAERAGLLASVSHSLRETQADPRVIEALAREIARVEMVMPRGERGACPVCHRSLVWPLG